MTIIVILAAAGLFFLLQRFLYRRLWARGLEPEIGLGRDRCIFEGEAIEVEETLINDKWLPLPWVYFKFKLSANGRPAVYQSDMFSIANRHRIRRKRSFKLPSRGVYQITDVTLVSHDLFLSETFSKEYPAGPGTVTVYPRLLNADEFELSYEQLTGDIVARRFSLEDPYLFKGIRDYAPSDSLKNINFKASARSMEWKVNMHETTVSQNVRLILGMDKATRYYDPVVYEQGLRIAVTLASLYEQAGIPVSFWSNGADSLDGGAVSVDAGCGEDHIYTILTAAARIDAEHEEGSVTDELSRAALSAGANTQYVLVTPAYRQGVREAFEALREVSATAMWIMPVTVAENSDPYFEPGGWRGTLPGFFFWVV